MAVELQLTSPPCSSLFVVCACLRSVAIVFSCVFLVVVLCCWRRQRRTAPAAAAHQRPVIHEKAQMAHPVRVAQPSHVAMAPTAIAAVQPHAPRPAAVARFCAHCGHKHEAAMRFCSACGAAQHAAQAGPQPQPPSYAHPFAPSSSLEYAAVQSSAAVAPAESASPEGQPPVYGSHESRASEAPGGHTIYNGSSFAALQLAHADGGPSIISVHMDPSDAASAAQYPYAAASYPVYSAASASLPHSS